MFPLEIFPQDSLSSSVITTVWVGVVIVVLLNLRFGTPISGLIVPGYLVPLLLVKPVSVIVIIVESLVTYGLAAALSSIMVRSFGCCEFFGRDRFFVLLLLSVSVRLLFDGALLPSLGEWMLDNGFQFDYRNNLHSFGLVIISLIANQFWNSGAIKGLSILTVYVALTLLVVRFVLMTITNFEISNLSYMYEDLASSILASPKAYIILLMAALVSSRMNLVYGWEFNGILIPSLLALQWYQPVKLLTTFFEAFVILGCSHIILKSRLCQATNFEGGRLLLLFFNVAFLYKIIVALVVVNFFSSVKVTDYYAFGYLLSSLIAVKIYQKDIMARLTRATLQTSAVATLMATVVGFCLLLLPNPFSRSAYVSAHATGSITMLDENVAQYVSQLKARLYESESGADFEIPLANELAQIDTGVRALLDYRIDRDDTLLHRAIDYLRSAGFKVYLLKGGYIAVEEIDPTRGWGAFIINLNTQSELLVSIPATLDEHDSVSVASWLFVDQQATALVMSGSRLNRDIDAHTNVLVNPNTAFNQLHKVFSHRNTIQVRAYTRSQIRLLLSRRIDEADPIPDDLPNQLRVKRDFPLDLKLKPLENALEQIEVHWNTSPQVNIQREQAYAGFAELYINNLAVSNILKSELLSAEKNSLVGIDRIKGDIKQWLHGEKENIAKKGSNLYQKPTLGELVYLDQEVVTPLLALSTVDTLDHSGQNVFRINQINSKANAIGLRVSHYTHKDQSKEFFILQEDKNREQRYWGTLVIRLGSGLPYVVQVPRPLLERSTLEYGASLLEKMDVKALLIAGSHPNANHLGDADILKMSNKLSVVNLYHQILLRENNILNPMVLQVRGFSPQHEVSLRRYDMLVARWRGLSASNDQYKYTALLRQLKSQNIRYREVDGSIETSGYDTNYNAQIGYMPTSPEADMAILWLSSAYRRHYKMRQAQTLTEFYNALFIDTREVSFNKMLGENWAQGSCDLLKSIQAIFNPNNLNIRHGAVDLFQLTQQLKGYAVTRLLDPVSNQSLLSVERSTGEHLIWINMDGKAGQQVFRDQAPQVTQDAIDQVIANKVGWLCGGS